MTRRTDQGGDLALRPLLHIERDALDRCYDQRAFRVTHELAGQPLFELEQLVELGAQLPTGLVEYNPGDLPISHDPELTPSNGLGVAETIRRIETCRSWMVLKHVQRVPEYAAVLDRCIDEVADVVGRPRSDFFHRAAFLFVSSPGSITPLHLDPECNFLLQVRGRKTIQIYDQEGDEIIDQRGLERFFSGGHRNVALTDERAHRGSSFHLEPGQGVYVPMPAPHYVRNGEAVSISFSVTFHTSESDTTQGVHWTNDKLRRIGLQPKRPGLRRRSDRLKYGFYRRLRGVKRVLAPRRWDDREIG